MNYDAAWLIARETHKRAMLSYVAAGGVKSINQFDRQLWTTARAFFTDEIDAFGFIDAYTAAIDNQLTRAWNDGAREVGVDPREFEDIDLSKLQLLIQNENEHILDLAQAIEDARNSGMTDAEFRGEFRARIDLWVNRYNEVANDARIYFGGREKLEWILGATEQHCITCARLSGIVAYASEWETSGIKPQNPPNPILECGGWRCDCQLAPTTRRKTPDALGRLLDIAASMNL